MQILSRVAEAVVEKPDGIVREVIFPQVKEETFHDLVAEFRASGPELRLLRQTVMQRKFARHYRRMLPALLESLHFRSDNRFQPVIEALAAIQRNLTIQQEHFSEQVPVEGVVWRSVCAEIGKLLREQGLDRVTLDRGDEPPQQSVSGKYRDVIPLKQEERNVRKKPKGAPRD